MYGVKIIELMLTKLIQIEISFLGEVEQVEPSKTADNPSRPASRNKKMQLKLIVFVNCEKCITDLAAHAMSW